MELLKNILEYKKRLRFSRGVFFYLCSMLDFIIVGFGLSGASTAFHLEQKGYNYVVFDTGQLNSSMVAGGVMNPVILNKFTLAWRAQEQRDLALKFYSALENYLETKFLSAVEIYRKFASIEEQNNWFAAADKPLLSPFLDTNLKAVVGEGIKGNYKFGKLCGTARVDTRIMLAAHAQKLNNLGRLHKEAFAYEDLALLEDGVEYRGIRAKRIIFCEGFGMVKNPFFNSLPLVGNKGEYIVIKAPALKLNVVVKGSVFISPLGDGLFVVGATYNNQDKTWMPSSEARAELEDKLSDLIDTSYEVVDQLAGIRPSTGDRRPLVGQHPINRQLYICNGFGSRGVLTAPMAVAELLSFIEDSTPISSEMDILRFRKRLLKS